MTYKGIVVDTFKRLRITCKKENVYVTNNDDTERMMPRVTLPQRTCPTPALKSEAAAAIIG
jgi:hypothetical protein